MRRVLRRACLKIGSPRLHYERGSFIQQLWRSSTNLRRHCISLSPIYFSELSLLSASSTPILTSWRAPAMFLGFFKPLSAPASLLRVAVHCRNFSSQAWMLGMRKHILQKGFSIV